MAVLFDLQLLREGREARDLHDCVIVIDAIHLTGLPKTIFFCSFVVRLLVVTMMTHN